MDEIREFLVLEEEEGERLDVYLSSQLGDMSRSYIQKIIKDKKVTVNNKIEKAKYLVKEEDKIIQVNSIHSIPIRDILCGIFR